MPSHFKLLFKPSTVKRLFRLALVLGLVLVTASGIAYYGYKYHSASAIHRNLMFEGEYDVALILGTSAYARPGAHNPYFTARMQAAAELYHSGRVRKLLVSGDNSRAHYNEPRDMQMALVALGVPADDIVLDYAGFRTFDSIVRCRQVFRQSKVVVVSQRFHLERALGIASAVGLDAIGYEADDPYPDGGYRHWAMHCREALARVRTFLDCHVLNTTPHFLGDPIDVFAAN
jgi:SanA protein